MNKYEIEEIKEAIDNLRDVLNSLYNEENCKIMLFFITFINGLEEAIEELGEDN